MNVLDFGYEGGYKTKCFLLFILSQINFVFGSGYVHKSVSDKENMKSNMYHSSFWMDVLTTWVFTEL